MLKVNIKGKAMTREERGKERERERHERRKLFMFLIFHFTILISTLSSMTYFSLQ